MIRSFSLAALALAGLACAAQAQDAPKADGAAEAAPVVLGRGNSNMALPNGKYQCYDLDGKPFEGRTFVVDAPGTYVIEDGLRGTFFAVSTTKVRFMGGILDQLIGEDLKDNSFLIEAYKMRCGLVAGE